MKKKFLLALMVVVLSIIAFGTISASAEKEEIYTYSVSNEQATITDCDESASGEIVIPSTLGGYPVTTIGDEAFYCCSSLTNITIPDSITKIGYYAFESCSNLTNITIPDSVTKIGFRAFCNCSSLVSITIPDKVTNIYYSTFYNCSSLTNITIPDSVTEIRDSAFENCSNLKNVYYNGTEAEWNNISIGSSNNELTNATRKYFLYVTLCDKDGTKISKRMQGFNTLVDTSEVVIPVGYKMVLYIDKEQTIAYDINTPISKNLTLYVDYKIEFEGTKTEVSEDKKSFSIKPINVKNGKTVILALYNGEQFVEMQSAVYTGEVVPFTTTKAYTKAKIMVWEDLTNLKPVCNIEIIE